MSLRFRLYLLSLVCVFTLLLCNLIIFKQAVNRADTLQTLMPQTSCDRQISNMTFMRDSVCEHFGKPLYPGEKLTAYSALRKRKLVSMVWQAVDDNCNLYVYSSYRDHLDWNIRIIGLGKRLNGTVPLRCYIWENRATKKPETVDGDLMYLPGGLKNGYVATITSCPIKKEQRPFAVSVTVNNAYVVTNILEVKYPAQKNTSFTVCVPVLHSNFKEVNKTISVIEMNKLLGAQRFVIYYYSAKPEVNTILDEYVKDGVLEIVNWDLPVKHIFYYGQDVVNNDCLYRNMFISKYLVFSDLDEVIMPKKHSDWMSFIKSVRTKYTNVGSFLFRNTYFCTNTERKIDTNGLAQSDEAQKYDVTPLLCVWRDKNVFPWKKRSKQIVISERIRAIRIHFIDRDMFRDGFKAHLVSAMNGLLHHYRHCDVVSETIKDDSVRKFTHRLLTNIKKKHLIIKPNI